jgi:RNA polymerase sigma-70 factor (ECF subfamily)
VAQARAAFATLYERHHQRVRRWLLRWAGWRWEEADDVAQEVFLTVARRAAEFNPLLATFSTWLWRIVRSRYVDQCRRRWHRPQPLLDWEPEEPPVPPSPDSAEVVARIRQCVEALSMSEHQVMVLRVDVELTRPQIAENLGIPIGTVDSRLGSARAHLLDCLGAYGIPLLEDPS